MAISDKLTKLAEDITASYNAVQAKGGNVPANKNTNNLPAAISSIEGGSGTRSDSWPGLGQRDNIPTEYEQIDYVTVEDGAYCYAQSEAEPASNSDAISSYSATASVNFPQTYGSLSEYNRTKIWPIFVPKASAQNTSCCAAWDFAYPAGSGQGHRSYTFGVWGQDFARTSLDPNAILSAEGNEEWRTFYVDVPNYNGGNPTPWTAITSGGMNLGKSGGQPAYSPTAFTQPTVIGQAGGVKLTSYSQEPVRYYNIRGYVTEVVNSKEYFSERVEGDRSSYTYKNHTIEFPWGVISYQDWIDIPGNEYHLSLYDGREINISRWEWWNNDSWKNKGYYWLYDDKGQAVNLAVESWENHVDTDSILGVKSVPIKLWDWAQGMYITFVLLYKKEYYAVSKKQNLKIDFVPVRRKSDNVVGFYDVINSVFHESLGTVPFKGPGE